MHSEISFPEELEHLAEIDRILEEALREADAAVGRRDQEYMDQKRYMVEYRGEIDPNEMFQNELALRELDHVGAFTVKLRDKIAKLKQSPYFARIDFLAAESLAAMECYIGRFSFTHDNELLIYDWRAPVASMFYDYEIGPAGYDAPIGRVEGRLTRKRQFKINGGKMEYALETSANIQDDVLQRELSHTSDERMKSIIATIQKEQNQIIRNEQTSTLLIQGVAGSGKTSIALHRIAFLLYRWGNRLSAKNVLILSPNRVFGDYIAGVLPELGEEPVNELCLADIAKVQLAGLAGFEAEGDPLEIQTEDWAQRVRFKSTLEFVRLCDDFIRQMPHLAFVPADYTYGRFTAGADIVQSRFEAYSKLPIKQRLQRVADDLHDRFATSNFMEEEVPRAKTILKGLHAMLKIKNALALYKAFYQQIGRPELFHMPAKKTLEWADVFPFLYLHAAYEGLKESGVIRHLVVDEMQDYTPIQYAVLNLLFRCQKTILGDFGQLINPNHQHTLQDLRRLYDGAQFAELNKSYRSTYEIISFARKLQNVSALEPVERHGPKPEVLSCGSFETEIAQILERIVAFQRSGNASLGIIAKTNQQAKALYDILIQDHALHLLSPESRRFANGVLVTSIRMSKGLEFDEVIVTDVDKKTYATEYDRSLLYIACTRAMHKLALLYTGEPSGFLPENEMA